MIIAKDLDLPNLRFFKPSWPSQDIIEGPGLQIESQGCELISKKSFMERLLSARTNKRPEGQGGRELYGPRALSNGKLWF